MPAPESSDTVESDTVQSGTPKSSREQDASSEASRDMDPTEQDEDPIVAASALLEAALACAESDDAQCAEAVIPGATAALPTLVEIAAANPTPHLVDEYGDVAVVRVERGVGALDEDSVDAASMSMGHILVLVRSDKKWLVRDVYDVADQPE